MSKVNFLTATATMLALAVPLSAARADVYIALQQAGVNGGARTTVTSDPSFATFTGSYGSFSINSITGTSLTALLDSTALNVSGNTQGELKIYVTSAGLSPAPRLGLLASLTSNLLPKGWTAVISAWEDPLDVPFGQTLLLGEKVFDTIGTYVNITSGLFNTPYSTTVVYDLTSTGRGTSELTAHVAAVPEPSSLVLLAWALGALGFWGRRLAM